MATPRGSVLRNLWCDSTIGPQLTSTTKDEAVPIDDAHAATLGHATLPTAMKIAYGRRSRPPEPTPLPQWTPCMWTPQPNLSSISLPDEDSSHKKSETVYEVTTPHKCSSSGTERGPSLTRKSKRNIHLISVLNFSANVISFPSHFYHFALALLVVSSAFSYPIFFFGLSIHSNVERW
ncbi:hypothetical protein DFJ77DRAFT_46257 [Powellomyces hirtus]|nr:hypothetical protein DFJ77DRAFT_46257 [Powellomyces hirtus]